MDDLYYKAKYIARLLMIKDGLIADPIKNLSSMPDRISRRRYRKAWRKSDKIKILRGTPDTSGVIILKRHFNVKTYYIHKAFQIIINKNKND